MFQERFAEGITSAGELAETGHEAFGVAVVGGADVGLTNMDSSFDTQIVGNTILGFVSETERGGLGVDLLGDAEDRVTDLPIFGGLVGRTVDEVGLDRLGELGNGFGRGGLGKECGCGNRSVQPHEMVNGLSA
jgi:hypothetical protein